MICYKSDTDPGLNEADRKCLQNVLEQRFGYNLCLYDRDVLPGKGMLYTPNIYCSKWTSLLFTPCVSSRRGEYLDYWFVAAEAEAVLDCIEQSRMVVLVPTCLDPGLGSGLLSSVYAVLEEEQISFTFIKTQTKDVRSGSLPEESRLLGGAGHCVTWEGLSSRPLSSSFWKQLHDHLPAPRSAPKTTWCA